MSFCSLLNAGLLFTGVVAFIIAGFAGTFSSRLHACRYRIMLAPLGFVVLGGVGLSITERLVRWFTHGVPPTPISFLGSGADIFESAVLVFAGMAGLFAGVALGATLDRVPPAEQTYIIANYWRRHRSNPGDAKEPPAGSDKVIAISSGRKQPGVIRRVNAISDEEKAPIV